jgi:KipI family sensor histidine kinase inhibitor
MNHRVLPAGDSAWLIELPERIDPAVNARAIEIASLLEDAPLPIEDIVVGYRSVMVYVDPLAPAAAGAEAVLQRIAASAGSGAAVVGPERHVPVCYDGDCAPDLADVAAFAGCSADDVMARHLARDYRVYVVGFVPGFAYMATVDPSIAAPRRASPRPKVPPGSVGIAAGQTGIYPAATPGGWHLVGRCPIRPFDSSRRDPFLFHPGDRVRFHRISAAEYRAVTQWGDA